MDIASSHPTLSGPRQSSQAFRRAAVGVSWSVPLLVIAGFATATVREGIPLDFIPCSLAALLFWASYGVAPHSSRGAMWIGLGGLGFLGLTVILALRSAFQLSTISMENGAQADLVHRLLVAGDIALLPITASLLLRAAGRQFSVQRLAHPAARSLWVLALLVLLWARQSTISHPHSFAWAFACWGISLDLMTESVVSCVRDIRELHTSRTVKMARRP